MKNKKWIAICALVVAVLATYYFFRLASKAISGEVFVQLPNGRVIFASSAEVTAFSTESERGKKWLRYRFFDENRRQRSESIYVATDSAELKDLKQTMLYSSDLIASSGVVTMPANTGGEKFETVCDARGRFQLRLRPGEYWLIVSGRAGDVNGIWSKEIDVPRDQIIEFSEGDATLDRSMSK